MSDDTERDDELDVFGRVFTLKTDLRQRDVAAWNRVFVEQTRGTMAAAVERQASLQGAIEAGWVLAPETRVEQVVVGMSIEKRYYFDGMAVDDMPPAQVNYYGRICSRLYDTLMAIPKASSST